MSAGPCRCAHLQQAVHVALVADQHLSASGPRLLLTVLRRQQVSHAAVGCLQGAQCDGAAPAVAIVARTIEDLLDSPADAR